MRLLQVLISYRMEKDKAFLEFVVKELVDNPDDVVVNRTVDEMGVLLTLRVHPDDMGKVIGKSGNTAKSIRTLLRVVGMKSDARVNLKIEEPEGGKMSDTSGGNGSQNENSEQKSQAAEAINEALGDLKV